MSGATSGFLFNWGDFHRLTLVLEGSGGVQGVQGPESLPACGTGLGALKQEMVQS